MGITSSLHSRSSNDLQQAVKGYESTTIQGSRDVWLTRKYSRNEVDEGLNSIGCGAFQIIAFSLAGLAYIAFNCQAVSFAYINLQISQQWNLTEVTYAILPATTGACNMFGGLLYAYLTDMYGRVWPYATSMLIVGACVMASAFSPSFPVLVVLRALGAIGVGGILGMIYPMFVEFLPLKNRGQAGVLLMLSSTAGNCIAAGLAWWLIPTYPINGWRYLVFATSLPSFLVFCFRLVFYVESPRFLVSKNKMDAAWNTFTIMARINCKNLNSFMDKEEFCKLTKETGLGPEQKNPLHLWKTFVKIFSKRHIKHTVCLLMVHVAMFMSYIGTTLFLPTLLKNLGVDPYSGAFIGFSAQVPGVLLMAIITEWPWFGRLNSLRVFAVMAAIFFFLLAFLQNEVTIPLFTVFLYFSLSPTLSLLHTYTAECYPTEIRAMALSVFDIAISLSNIWVSFCGGYLTDLSPTYPWLFSTVWGSLVTFGFVASLALNRETRGRNLQESFGDRK